MVTCRSQQKKSIREYMRGGKEHVQLTALSKVLPGNVSLYSVLTLIPGASIGYHVHEDDVEMLYFIEGYGRVQDDDEFYDVCAGDSMVTFKGHGHSVENTGNHDLIILATIITG